MGHIKKKIGVGVLYNAMLILTGCSNSQTYNKVSGQVKQSLDKAKATGGATVSTGVNLLLYKFATGCKAITPAVVTGSIALGVLILMIVKKDPVWRKRAIFLFIIAIPVLMLVLSYGLAILLSIFVF